MKAPGDLTKEELINDLMKLRQRINELAKIEEDKNKYLEELNKTKAMYEGLFEFAPDAIVVGNREGRIVQVNKRTEKLFGYTREELLSSDLDNLLPERFREKHKKHRARYMSEPHVRPMGSGLDISLKMTALVSIWSMHTDCSLHSKDSIPMPNLTVSELVSQRFNELSIVTAAEFGRKER